MILLLRKMKQTLFNNGQFRHYLLYALGEMVLVVLGMIKRQRGWMRAAAVFALTYLTLGVVQRERAFGVQADLAERRGHSETLSMATVKPSIGNLILWRSLYRHGGVFHVDALRVGPLGSSRVYAGQSVPALDLENLLEGVPLDSVLARDLKRFEHFSAGYLAPHSTEGGMVVGDCRYARLPGSIEPLWGIRYDPAWPERHVDFGMFHQVRDRELEELFRMIRGQDGPDD